MQEKRTGQRLKAVWYLVMSDSDENFPTTGHDPQNPLKLRAAHNLANLSTIFDGDNDGPTKLMIEISRQQSHV